MTINLINPNFNLINTARTAGTEQGAGSSGDPANGAAGGARSFSDVLETVISNAVISNAGMQNASSGGNTVSSASGSAVNLDEIFQKAADAYHVPVELLKAVARAESDFDPLAVSHAGAQGVMQLMPGTAKALGVTNAFDPEQNIMGGAKYLSQQLERYGGNTVLALAAYNAGPGNVAKYNGVPPFEETQNYIAKVMGYAGEPITAGVNLGVKDYADLDVKDYAMLMDLYRYRMQLNVLSDPGSNPESESDSFNIFSNLTGLV